MANIQSSIYSAFVVNRIKELYFSLNEDLLIDFKPNKITFEIGESLGANIEHNLLNLTLRAFIRYSDSEEVIADIKVQNVFVLPELDKFISKSILKLPTDTIVSMVSVSIAHTRALLAKNLAGTPLEKAIIPIVNPLTLSQELFPNLFNNKGLKKATPNSVKRKKKET